LHAQPPQHPPRQRGLIQRPEPFERGHQRRRFGRDQAQGDGQLPQFQRMASAWRPKA
jgi:hypothetical protein